MNTNKKIFSLFVAGLTVMVSGCTTLDETGKLEGLCNSVGQNEICAHLDTQDLGCSESRTQLVLHRIEEYQNGGVSAKSAQQEIPLLTNHRLCLEKQFDDMPIFQTAKRNVIKEELIHTKENINKIKEDLKFLQAISPGKKRILVG